MIFILKTILDPQSALGMGSLKMKYTDEIYFSGRASHIENRVYDRFAKQGQFLFRFIHQYYSEIRKEMNAFVLQSRKEPQILELLDPQSLQSGLKSPPSHPRHVSPPHSQLYLADHGLPKFPSPESQSKTLSQHWSPHTKNTLSPRRPGPMMTMAKPGPNNSMYYYSDTLKRKGISDNIEPMHRGDQESDSGISSR